MPSPWQFLLQQFGKSIWHPWIFAKITKNVLQQVGKRTWQIGELGISGPSNSEETDVAGSRVQRRCPSSSRGGPTSRGPASPAGGPTSRVIAMEGDGFWTDILRNRVSNKIDGELAGLDDLEIPRMQETQYGVKDCMVLFSGDRQRSSSCW